MGTQTNNSETRSAIVKAELRTESEGGEFVISGYAALFNSPSKDLGGFVETIARGAFDRALREEQLVRFTFNHSLDEVLARTDNGTLKLSTDSKGLKFRAQLNKRIQRHSDLWEACRAGLYNECSFAFVVPNAEGQSWSPDGGQRTLKDVDLRDVSLVGIPAYKHTSAAARSVADASYLAITRARLAELDADFTRQERANEIILSVLAENRNVPIEDSEDGGDGQAEDQQEEFDCLRDAIAAHFGQAHHGLTPRYFLDSHNGSTATCLDMNSYDLQTVKIPYSVNHKDDYQFGQPQASDDDAEEDSLRAAQIARQSAELRFRMEVAAGRR